jgi:hypothetical protein
MESNLGPSAYEVCVLPIRPRMLHQLVNCRQQVVYIGDPWEKVDSKSIDSAQKVSQNQYTLARVELAIYHM